MSQGYLNGCQILSVFGLDPQYFFDSFLQDVFQVSNLFLQLVVFFNDILDALKIKFFDVQSKIPQNAAFTVEGFLLCLS